MRDGETNNVKNESVGAKHEERVERINNKQATEKETINAINCINKTLD